MCIRDRERSAPKETLRAGDGPGAVAAVALGQVARERRQPAVGAGSHPFCDNRLVGRKRLPRPRPRRKPGAALPTDRRLWPGPPCADSFWRWAAQARVAREHRAGGGQAPAVRSEGDAMAARHPARKGRRSGCRSFGFLLAWLLRGKLGGCRRRCGQTGRRFRDADAGRGKQLGARRRAPGRLPSRCRRRPSERRGARGSCASAAAPRVWQLHCQHGGRRERRRDALVPRHRWAQPAARLAPRVEPVHRQRRRPADW